MQWTLGNPVFEQAAHFKKFREERQLSHRRRVRTRVPFHLDTPARRDHAHRRSMICYTVYRTFDRNDDLFELTFAFTHLVTSSIP